MTLLAAAPLEDLADQPRPWAKGPRVAVISLATPLDPLSWSGTPHRMLGELRRRFADVHVIDTPRADAVLRRLSVLGLVGLLPAREPLVCAWFGRHLGRRLTALSPDVVVAVAAEGKVAALAGRWPMVVVSDSFFANMLDYYPRYARLAARVREAGHDQQRRLLDQGAAILLGSAWAARTAAEAYGRPVSRFGVAPFGANFEPEDWRSRPDDGGPIRLLFVGVDWRRKGGALAVAAFEILRRRFGDAELHIVGSRPDVRGPGLHCHGRLSKDRAADASLLRTLYAESSFVFTPSRQEAFGLVFAEACAFGVPPVAADTGGVGEIIRHGVNGLLLSASATAADYAEAIGALWTDRPAYGAMRRAAREAFETRLNWTAWGDAMERAIDDCLRKNALEQGRSRAIGSSRDF